MRKTFIISLIFLLGVANAIGAQETFINSNATSSLPEFCIDSLQERSICQYEADHLLGQTADLFYYQEREQEGFEYLAHDDWSNLVKGTDLGISVRMDDATLYFFGDSLPDLYWDEQNNGIDTSGPAFGLPWGYDYDEDGRLDMIDVRPDEDGSGFVFNSVTQTTVQDMINADTPITELFNQNEIAHMFGDGFPSYKETGFFVPTGVAQANNETVYLWYGKYVSNCECDQSHLLAMDYSTGTWRYLSAFAEKKFVITSAVPVSEDQYPAEQDECQIPWSEPGEQGFLIYGAGRDVDNTVSFDQATPIGPCARSSQPGYRRSKLYLGYISLEDLESGEAASRMHYFSGTENGCWTQGDIDQARPVVPFGEFGEFSAMPIPDTPYVLLANTSITGRFHLRVADLARPWKFTRPLSSASFGYGNYIVEDSVRLTSASSRQTHMQLKNENRLYFKRVVSTWLGLMMDPLFRQYGTASISSVVDFDFFEQDLERIAD